MSSAGHDEVRAAATLVAIAACHGHPDMPSLLAAVLGADPDTDRCAAIACTLAGWLAEAVDDPRAFGLDVIAASVSAEATEGTP